MPHVIDGYNLLRAIQRSDEAFESLKEVGLCRILSQYLGDIRDHGHIIFDGIGPPDKSELGGIKDLEVYFSGADVEADDLIIEDIQENTAPRKLVVVSSDRKLRTAAARRKAVPVRSELFWIGLMQRLGRDKPTPEPPEKRRGITEMEADEWLKYFDIE